MQYVIYSSHHVNIEVVDPRSSVSLSWTSPWGTSRESGFPHSCPAEAPWLLSHQWDKSRKVFPGIAVTEPGGIGVSMTAAEQFDGNGRATGSGPDWTNSAELGVGEHRHYYRGLHQ